MKKALLLACLLLTYQAFAQTEPPAVAVNIAGALSKDMCECLNEHALPKLSNTAKKGLEKLQKSQVTTKEDVRKILSIKEMMSINNELEQLNAQEEGELADCKSDAAMGMMQFSGQVTELLAQKQMTEEELDKAIEAQMLVSLSKLQDCRLVYLLFLISK